ncbi:MAG: hypothetical protein HY308_16135 [Gammaproteobacteria bacterium]|nr:hypothetical protein [Gammaproteobacteria bacterium]
MNEVRELTLKEVTAIRQALEYRVSSIKLELDEHDRGIRVLGDEEASELSDDLYWYEHQLLYDFLRAEREAFGLRDATNPEAEPYPGTASDTPVMLEFKDVSFIRAALTCKVGDVERQLQGEDLDEAKRRILQDDLTFYEELFRMFETAETMAPKLRQLPQIALRRKWKF